MADLLVEFFHKMREGFCGKSSAEQRLFLPFNNPNEEEKQFKYIQGKFWKIKEAMEILNSLSQIAPKNYD